MDLFEYQGQHQKPKDAPLAELMRPTELSEFVGQGKVIGPQSPLMRLIETQGVVPNLILWGPPGSGKTTLAHLLVKKVSAHIEMANAVDTGAKRLREIGEEARHRRLQFGQKTIVFIDEIHRLNKAQQDVLLPYSERGDFSLIGATTENPSYELTKALLSRSRVIVFEKISTEDLKTLVHRVGEKLKLSIPQLLSAEALEDLVSMADGDARRLLNLLEQIVQLKAQPDSSLHWPLEATALRSVMDATPLYYDKQGDEHYDTISAFIKSVRGSDPDAALYYLARMLEGGEDPVFLARRLVILASEDIGNADPRGLLVAVAGLQAVELVGMPEAAINLAQVTSYLASAPKSNRSYMGLKKAQELVRQTGRLPIPMALRSSRTALAKDLGYGRDYRYSHDGPKGFIAQDFLPEKLKGTSLYEPSERGFEKNIREFLEWLKK